MDGLFRIEREWQGGGWEIFQTEAEDDAELVFEAVVAVADADAGDEVPVVAVEGVLLEFEGAVVHFEGVVVPMPQFSLRRR